MAMQSCVDMTHHTCVSLSLQVLELLWNLAHRDDCPTDTMDHALNAHIKILDYSCSQVHSLLTVVAPNRLHFSPHVWGWGWVGHGKIV